MPRQDSTNEAELLHGWVDRETRPLDLIASWETLTSVYETLRFADKLTDDQRIGEFKWIIRELNKFLTRQRTRLMSCQDIPAAMDSLKESFTPTGKVTIETRQAVAYHKLRQQWINASLTDMEQMIQTLIEMEEESSEGAGINGWNGTDADAF